jgi:hypothetical protein
MMMSYSANMSLWQEFREQKSGNEGKAPEVYGGCKAGRRLTDSIKHSGGFRADRSTTLVDCLK